MAWGADKGANGENAIKVSAGTGSLIMGPLGIVIPNGMLGEIPANASLSWTAAFARAAGARDIVTNASLELNSC